MCAAKINLSHHTCCWQCPWKDACTQPTFYLLAVQLQCFAARQPRLSRQLAIQSMDEEKRKHAEEKRQKRNALAMQQSSTPVVAETEEQKLAHPPPSGR